MKITVTGSLGNISKPLAETLISKGHDVTIISSNEDKKKDIEALGARAAIGSIEDTAFLTSAFAGADAVYVMVPPNLGTTDMKAYYERVANSYAAAIKQAGVKQVVSLSSIGTHVAQGTGPITGARAAEAILSNLQNVSITFLRPAFFYTNLYNYAGMIKGMNIIGDNYGGSDRIIFAAPQDIAAAAATAFEKPAPGKTVRYVVSDDRAANEAAAIVGAAIAKPDLTWVAFSDADTLAALQQNGMPAHAAEMFIQMGQSVRSGVLWEDYDKHAAEAYKGKTALQDFAEEFSKAF